jgi:hypothetical protein
MNSLACNGMWGMLQVTDGHPVDGWDVTIAILRSVDNRKIDYHAKLVTSAFFTPFLQDRGGRFTVIVTIGTPRGVVSTQTPCSR